MAEMESRKRKRSSSVSSAESVDSNPGKDEMKVEEELFSAGDKLTGDELKKFLKKNFLDFADELADIRDSKNDNTEDH